MEMKIIALFFFGIYWFDFITCISDYQQSRVLAYYACLEKREYGFVENRRVNPNPIVIEEGQIFILPCVECRNPVRSPEYWIDKSYKWYYRLWQPDAIKIEVPVSDSRSIKSGYFVEKPYHNLVAIGVNNSHFGGEYFCEDEKRVILSNYDVDVVPEIPVKIVMPDEEVDEVNEPLSSFDGVEVATEWTMWTGCNRCGTVAERRRYGNCAVVRNKFMELPKREDLVELFERYPLGVPCRFSWLPIDVQNFPLVKDRPNFIQTELCKFYCVTQPPIRYITERTKGGEGYRIIEKVKRDRYSVREVLPRLPQPVLRIVRDTVASDGLALYCPAADEEIFWKKGENSEDMVVLTTATLHKATSDRIFMDENRNLVFDYLEGEDQGIFSCWNSDGVLLMTATINVSEPAKDALIQTALILTSVVIICCVGFYILWSSFKMKK